MPATSPRPIHAPRASSAYQAGPRLTAEDWALILAALSAYKHNAAYRDLYEKLAPQQTRP